MAKNPGLILVTGIFIMAGGVATVVGHNIWSGGALPVAVTVLGWMTLIKGVVLMAAPPRTLNAIPAYQPIDPNQVADSGGPDGGNGRATAIRPVMRR